MRNSDQKYTHCESVCLHACERGPAGEGLEWKFGLGLYAWLAHFQKWKKGESDILFLCALWFLSKYLCENVEH